MSAKLEELETEVKLLRAVARAEFDRRFDTPEEQTAYQLGVRDVKQELESSKDGGK